MWWSIAKKLLSRFEKLNIQLGDIVFETERENGAIPRSYFEWRVRKSLKDEALYVSVEMESDLSTWTEGETITQCYINFDIGTAKRLRDNLERCIEFMEEQKKHDSVLKL